MTKLAAAGLLGLVMTLGTWGAVLTAADIQESQGDATIEMVVFGADGDPLCADRDGLSQHERSATLLAHPVCPDRAGDGSAGKPDSMKN